MKDATAFRGQLRRQLESADGKILLRIVPSLRADQPLEFTGPQILAQGQKLVQRSASQNRSSVVVLLLPHCPELFLLHIGLVLEGQWPAILPWPTTRIDPQKYQRNLVHQLGDLPAGQLITTPVLATNLRPSLPYEVIGCAIEGAADFERNFTRAFHDDAAPVARPAGTAPCHPGTDPLFLQFSGGTTGMQKCVVVSAPMLCEQLWRLGDILDFSEKDSVVSWLPMYHDMGLIACLWFPLWFGASSLQFAASDWLLKPEQLFHYLDRFKGTFCWLPNFAFSYLAQRRDSMKGSYSLSHVRGWINCSEPVRLRSMASFAAQFAEWRVRKETLQASYAMAENVFAVTQTALDTAPATRPRKAVKAGPGRPPALAFDLIDDVYVSSGRPLKDVRIRIRRADGTDCSEEEAGEIQLRTPCLFGGYWGRQGFRADAFTEDGWYATGDYGFLSGGELYVIGRIKDIVIVGGQNIFPEDVESVVGTVEGVYPGRVVTFGIEDEDYGTQSLVVVAEMRGDFDAGKALSIEAEIRRLVVAAVGVAARHVAVVPERWIVKSTAGKISRRDTRERFRTEKLLRTQTEAS